MTTQSDEGGPRSHSNRVVTAVFGAFFVALAVAILVMVDRSMIVGAVIAALIVGGLGVDALVSAARNRRSLMSRIGPLP